jgi:MerR family transcriptional regulator, light-induced transcriptional regulator
MEAFSMKTVLRMTGLSADTLRAWERRYGAVCPSRSPSGRRVYSNEEIHRLKLLSDLVSKGNQISTIASLNDEALVDRIAKCTSHSSVKAAPSKDVSALITTIENFNLVETKRLLSRFRFFYESARLHLSPRPKSDGRSRIEN